MLRGHLKDGCIVHATVELVIASDRNLNFEGLLDGRTGFDELSVTELKHRRNSHWPSR